MKKTLLFYISTFVAFSSIAQDCTQPFISEYVEGFGNNKALEIYNPTNDSLDLTPYFLQRFNNGSTTAAAQGTFEARTIQLQGIVPPKSVLVYVLDRRDPNATGQDAPIWKELEEKGDYFLSPVYSVNNVMNFNGNDALLLGKGDATNPNTAQTVVIDVFGKIGEDPNLTSGTKGNGWTTVAPYNGTSTSPNDVVVTADHSMIRKEAIKKGFVPVPLTGGDPWNPLAEWDSLPARIAKLDANGDTLFQSDGVTPQWDGNWASLGTHTCVCDTINTSGTGGGGNASIQTVDWNAVYLYPNPSQGIFSLIGANEIMSAQLYDALGQQVTSITNDDHLPILNVKVDAQPGVYMLRLNDKNGFYSVRRIVIK